MPSSPVSNPTTAAETPAQIAGRAERPLRLLVAAAFVLPVAIFVIASIIGYFSHVEEANLRQQRTLGIVYEHATKVFETFDLAARYTDGLTSDSDTDVREDEAGYRTRLHSLTSAMPQLLDVWVIGADGHPLVSGTVFPMPRDLDLSNRPYFRALKNDSSLNTYISEVLDSAIQDFRFFAYAKRRSSPDNEFNGVMSISARPEYFSSFYSTLPAGDVESIALVRLDGAILARYPVTSNTIRSFAQNSTVLKALQDKEVGIIETASPFDGKERVFAFRRLAGLDVVALTGIESATITRQWLSAMSRHLIFGVPATASLIALSFVALVRTRRESFAYESLRREVARREQTEQALRQAQKMEAVGRLTGGIAHDFNNLLTAILGNVDLALRRADEKDGRLARLLNSARQASERAATLVQRLLAFSRQHPLEVKAVDLNRLVQGMSDLLRRTIGETIDVETVLAAGLWKTAVDPNQLENAIINLALNARDSMQNGGRLTIETANTYLDETYIARNANDLSAGQYVMLAVSDSGSGMTKDVMDRAFEPFFTTKPPGVGSGLGLSMVYGFVKQSGGHIKIYSEAGEGTSIKLYFPKLDAASDFADWRPDGTTALPAAAPQPAPRTEMILLVEDDTEVNAFATDVLSGQGYRVLSAFDGPSALRLLDANPDIRLLFTDVVLPGGMNGRQLSTEALARRPDLKVLYATGYTRNAIIHQGRLDRDLDLLTKPFTHDLLVRKVQQILDGKISGSTGK